MIDDTKDKPLALVVDDDVSLGMVFAEVLTMIGFETQVIHDARLTIDIMNERLPVLVSLDMQMPHLSGVDILRKIRSEPRFASVKVIMVTGNGRVAEEADINDLVDLILIKPVTFNQIKDFAMRLTKA